MIEILEARIAPATFTVTTNADSGAGSLRQAILDANADAVGDIINFNIPGDFTHRILLNSGLPQITQPVTINGYSEPGSIANSAINGTNAVIMIEIDGANTLNTNGITVFASNVTIRGLAIFGFEADNSIPGNSVKINNGSNIVVAGCFLGTDASGLGGSGNTNDGVDLSTTVSSVTIGGATPADRNLISNNLGGSGITARGTNVVIKGNVIGTGPDGFSPVPNGRGISAGFITNATIGGGGVESNVIAQNRFEGIELFSNASGVNIFGNSIFRNGRLGFDLGGSGVTPNDPLDADTGQNDLQNFPVITGVDTGAGTAQFSLDTTPSTMMRVDFYLNTEPDSSTFGEGRFYAGSFFGTTDANGHLEGSVLLSGLLLPGITITSTATNLSTLNTSEFSQGFNVNTVTITNEKMATWIDSDGDRVTLKITKGTLTPQNFFFSPGVVSDGAILKLLNLTDESFNGTNLTFSVKKAVGGNGRVDVGLINAPGRDLGNVTLLGDLGRIICGDTDTTTLSLKKLKVTSLGVSGAQTLPDALNDSTVTGPAGSIQVIADINGATFRLASLNGTPEELLRTRINSFQVGGDVTSSAALSGAAQIFIDGFAGRLNVLGDLVAQASGTGTVRVSGGVGTLTVGNVFGGSIVLATGSADFGGQGKVTVRGDVAGGLISLGEQVDQVSVTGSVIGIGSGSGVIQSSGSLSKVVIGGDLVGSRSGQSISTTGVITVNGSLGSVLIKGSVIGASTFGSGTVFNSGLISAADSIGSVVIGGDTLGNSAAPVVIRAGGQEVKPASGFDVAIGSVTIKGSAVATLVLAGFNIFGNPVNADASIGSIAVGKNWVGSSVAAGAEDSGLPGFGVGDTLQSVGDTGLVSHIASITIRGAVLPGLDPNRQFGFVAQEIAKLQVGGFRVPLAPGLTNDNLVLGAFPNIRVLEV